MDRIAKALYERDEVFAQINDVLFNGGADELISKLTKEEQKFQRRQAQVGLASNVVGLAAGAAGTYEAGRQYKKIRGQKIGTVFTAKPLKIGRKTKVLAGAALGLQVANVGGDLVANRVLARSAKKKDVHLKKSLVIKSGPDASELHVNGPLKLRAVKAGAKKAKPVLEVEGKKLADKIKKADEVDVLWEGEFSKVDIDKRQVFGYASVVEVNGEPVVDRQGDYISIDEIEKAAYTYVQKSRKGGDMHKRNGEEAHHVSDMIESFVITKEKIEKMGLPPETPIGWWVGFQIHDEDTWAEVKKGNRKDFSIHGRGRREEVTL